MTRPQPSLASVESFGFSRRPRVLHIVPALFGGAGVYGGAERYALELARHMAEVTPTRLVSFGTNPAREAVGSLDIRVLGPAWRVRGQQFNPFHPGLIRHLRWAEVVHCHQRFIVASSFAAAFGRLTGRRVFVSDLGGGGWDVAAYIPTDRWFRGHLNLREYSRTPANHRDRVRARVIYGGVDAIRFAPDPAVPREPLAVYVGRIMPHKGINDLIEALPEGMSLEVIGRPYHDRFAADLGRLAANKPVHFRHDCDDDEIIRAYRRATCVVLPSVYRSMYGDETRVPELLGQTLLEAMACATPAIGTAVASLPEVVADGVTGFIVAPNNPAALGSKLEWLRDHPEAALVMGEAARRRVLDQFTWPGVVSNCLEAYVGPV